MLLLTNKLKSALPKLYSNEDKGDSAMIVGKFFCPWNQWTWYLMEYDGEDTFFGYVIGMENELGYFSLSELKSITKYGMGIERDKHFKPLTLRELKEEYKHYYIERKDVANG